MQRLYPISGRFPIDRGGEGLQNEIMKSEFEIREKLVETLAIDGGMASCKAAVCKTLLWALGENDDDRWHITVRPGPAIETDGAHRSRI
jgi:hypothetical protein